ncbi:hypothetical protein LWI28_003170 [Acer negundo]|uniref:glucan endo-1,3-beta-D-glucosidase n=1 Tax=Acer negundo TaxID=4023 RepID=A0AAD5NTL6_ACENE|nr:hypothetical protein LWI28_003170 [Acer negundo]
MATLAPTHVLFVSLLLLQALHFSSSQSFVGVNYGQVADNLPPPAATVKLLQSTSIQKVRLYGADPAIIRALANTGIGIVIGAGSGDIPSLAADPNAAAQWVNSNVLPFYPASKIILITVGNEVMISNDQNLISQLLPAMQNLQNALNSASLGGKIKVSTVHAMSVLAQSDPPSSGLFIPGLQNTMRGLLQFLKDTGSPFTINPYPFFAYQSDPRPETLAFCLFQPNSGRVDSRTGIKYMNMFDAQVDAVHSALNAMGFKDVEIVVAETGWPYRETPMRSEPKPGPASERAFGLFKPDLSATYDAGLSKTSQTPSTPVTPVTPSTKPTATGWCVPKTGVSDAQLQAGLDYACSQGIDCSSIQPGGACFEPNNVASHAAFAMNLYYQKSQKNPWNCDFSQTATLTSQNPSRITDFQKGRMVGLEMANTNGLESFGSTRKHTGNRIVNDRKADNGYAASVEGKIDHVKHTNGSKNVRGSVSKLKKSSDSKFDILSEEVDTVMAEGRVVGESSNKEVGNNKIKGNVLKKLHKDVADFEGQAVAMSGDSVCHITKTLSVPSPIEDKFEIVASELEKAMVVIS